MCLNLTSRPREYGNLVSIQREKSHSCLLVVPTAVSHSLTIFGLLERPFWTQASLISSCESVKKGRLTDLMVAQTTSFALFAWIGMILISNYVTTCRRIQYEPM